MTTERVDSSPFSSEFIKRSGDCRKVHLAGMMKAINGTRVVVEGTTIVSDPKDIYFGQVLL